MQTITTQEECERAGLLLLRAALEHTGWEWTLQVHERTVFVKLEQPDRAPALHVGPLVMAFEPAGEFDRFFCSAHDGSGRTSPSCGEYVFMRYAT